MFMVNVGKYTIAPWILWVLFVLWIVPWDSSPSNHHHQAYANPSDDQSSHDRTNLASRMVEQRLVYLIPRSLGKMIQFDEYKYMYIYICINVIQMGGEKPPTR